MDVMELLAMLHEPECAEQVRPGWDASQAAMPEGLPDFLRPEGFLAAREWCSIEPEHDAVLSKTAAAIAADPALLQLAWHGHYRLCYCDEGGFDQWPTLEPTLGPMAGVFYLLLSLSIVPVVRAKHESLGVPEEVSRETCLEIKCFNDNHVIGQGRAGIIREQLYWLRHYVVGELFRLGRFEYMVWPFHGALIAYRNQHTGQVVALAEDGTAFDEHGFIPRGATPTAWTASLREDGGFAIGCPIAPHGYAENREVRLDTREWKCVLKRGDDVLDMHIPSGGNMSPDRCLDSMRRALEFFPKHFPERTHVGLACYSWIFNTQFEEWLAPTANLVRHMRELYLFPIAYGGRDGLFFVFCRHDVNPATAPRDTALQRAMLDQIAAGLPLRASGMFVFEEDLAHYGTQQYRRQWPPDVEGGGVGTHQTGPEPRGSGPV